MSSRGLGSLIVAASCMLAAAASAQSTVASGPPLAVAVGHAEVEAAPDRAVVMLQVRATGKTAAEASRAGAARSQQVLDALRAKLGPGDRAETASNRVEPILVFDAGKPPRTTGWAAEHGLRAVTAKTQDVGVLLDAVTSAADVSIESVRFELADPAPAQAKALRLAAQDARARAAAIADGLGLALGAVRSAREMGAPGPAPLGEMRMRASADAGSSTPVLPPQLRIAGDVEVSFELVSGPRS